MRGHAGGIIGILATLAFVALNCLPWRGPGGPQPPVITGAPPGIVLRPVRVLLLAEAVQTRLAVSGPCEVRAPDTGQTLERLAFLPEGPVVVTPVGFRMGNRDYPGGALDLVPLEGALAEVDGGQYRGAIRLIQGPGSTFKVINVVALEPYLASVINGEMPSHWPAEALKAQAVAARTYALYQMQQTHRSRAGYDLRADQWSQVYLGLASETARSRRLVADTAGIVLTYQGRLFCTYYSSTCGGHTQDGRYVFADAAIPPLAGVECPYCAGTKYFRWERTMSMADLSGAVNVALAAKGQTVGEVTGLQVLQRGPSGHIARLRVLGTAGTIEMTGKAFRHALGTLRLPSTRFEVRPAPGGLCFAGGGFGHGVGLCQVGARRAAEAGLDFLQILQYYYPQSTAARVSAGPHT